MTNKSVLLLIFVFVASWMNAQTNDSRYLKGAVPEVDGKVVFSKDIKTKNPISDTKLFDLINGWINDKYGDSKDINNRILLSDADGKKIALSQESVLTFKSSAISLDRAFLRYQLLFEITDSNCKVTARNIKYLYKERDKDELFSAEDMITDKVAMSKDETKLNRYYDKFRIHTVDTINAIFDKIDIYLNGKRIIAALDNVGAVTASSERNEPMEVISVPATNITTVSVSNVATTSMARLDGYRSISADRIPGNIIKLLNDRILLTSGVDNAVAKTVSCGGLGKFGNQPVVFMYSDSDKNAGDDVFTVSFYTEAYADLLAFCSSENGRNLNEIKTKGFAPLATSDGLSFSGAWMIIECKPLFSVPVSEKNVVDKSLFGNLSKNGYIQMNAGQILNVWVK